LTGYLRLGNETNSPAVFFNPDSTTYSLTFSDFNGLNPNDVWTLFLSDTQPLGENTLNGWSLDIVAVPEPSTISVLAFGSLMALKLIRRKSVARDSINS